MMISHDFRYASEGPGPSCAFALRFHVPARIGSDHGCLQGRCLFRALRFFLVYDTLAFHVHEENGWVGCNGHGVCALGWDVYIALAFFLDFLPVAC